MNPIIQEEYDKAITKEDIKKIYIKYGFLVSAMITLKQRCPKMSLKEIHDEVHSWEAEK
jgi:hypothetical protein